MGQRFRVFDRGQNGITLLEVILAMGIFATGILLIMNSWSSNSRRIKAIEENHLIASLLEQRMAEVEAKYTGQPLQNIPEEDAGEFQGLPHLGWKLKSQELVFPDISPVLIQTGQNNQMLINAVKQMSEIIKRSIKEVRVTILVQPKGKKSKVREYSATTYFVDLTQGGQLGP